MEWGSYGKCVTTRSFVAFLLCMICVLMFVSVSSAKPTATIDSISPDPADDGAWVTFNGSGSGNASIAGYSWRSSVDGNLSDLSDFNTTDLSIGNHTIYFSVLDSEGNWSDEVTGTVVIDGSLNILFIHHSCGSNWLRTGDGNLRDELTDAGYDVHDATYGDDIGDSTDVCHWYGKFLDDLDLVLTFDVHEDIYYDDAQTNDIVMFKSCYPASGIGSNGTEPGDPNSSAKTMANYNATYNHLMEVFAGNPDVLFVPVTAPPLVPASTDDDDAERARRFNDWLFGEYVRNYTRTYGLRNVATFDLFDVLALPGNSSENASMLKPEYRKSESDSHPNRFGNENATALFILFIDDAVAKWKANADLVVDDDWAGADFDSIQDAINASGDGDTIRVHGGTYVGNITINRSVTINGNGTGVTSIVGNDQGIPVYIESPSVVFRGFSITGSSGSGLQAGIYCRGSDLLLEDLEVSCNSSGIRIGYVESVTVKDCVVDGNGMWGILTEWVDDLTVENCTMVNHTNYQGLRSYQGTNLTVVDCTLRDNAGGIEFWYIDGFGISGCDVRDNEVDGVRLLECDVGNVTNNSVRGNDEGVYVENCGNITLVNNEIFGNADHGINLTGETTDCIVHHNNFDGNGGTSSQAYDDTGNNTWGTERAITRSPAVRGLQTSTRSETPWTPTLPRRCRSSDCCTWSRWSSSRPSSSADVESESPRRYREGSN